MQGPPQTVFPGFVPLPKTPPVLQPKVVMPVIAPIQPRVIIPKGGVPQNVTILMPQAPTVVTKTPGVTLMLPSSPKYFGGIQPKSPVVAGPLVIKPKSPATLTIQPKSPATLTIQPKSPATLTIQPKSPVVAGPLVIKPKSPATLTIQPKSPVVAAPLVIKPKSPVVAAPLVIKPKSPAVAIQPRSPAVANAPVTFAPENIDEDTIVARAGTLTKNDFANLLKLLADYYTEEDPLVTDETYDELVDIYELKYGPYTVVGAEPTGAKVLLPYYLGSLRKLKERKEFDAYVADYPGPYIIEDKIDGLTLYYEIKITGGRKTKVLYTRGGGIKGSDVSHLIPYLRLPDANENIAVRGEVVMTKEAFARVGAGFKNARNLTSGIVNAKKQFDPNLASNLSFYAFHIMNKTLTPEQEVLQLQQMGFLVPNPVASPDITFDMLENYYKQRKIDAPYEMDGLVIYQNVALDYPVGSTPKHVIAFKIGTEKAMTTVTWVEWRPSKNMLLKPRVHYETVFLSGADLSKASGYNARFIVNNNIGPGAKILLTRSGDVIPKILSVIEPAPGGPSYPDPAEDGVYDWNANQVEFVVRTAGKKVIARRLEHFIDTLGIKNMGAKRVKSLVDAGIDTIPKLLTVTPQQLMAIPGIGGGLSSQFYQDLHQSIRGVSLAKIMDASNIFPGIGEHRFESILEIYPNLLDFVGNPPGVIANAIRAVKGFNTLADTIEEKLPTFKTWLQSLPMIQVEQAAPPPVLVMTATGKVTTQAPAGGPLSGATLVFSGLRPKGDQEARIKALGAKMSGSVSRNTTMVVVKSMDDLTAKPQKAIELGIPRMTMDDFVAQYLS